MGQTRLSRRSDHTTSIPEPLSERPELPGTGKQTLLAPRDPAVSLSPSPALTDAGHRISTFGLHAFYEAVEAVKGVTIAFPAHQVSAIIGPSGCGKSTLLRCINWMHEEIPGAHAEGQVMLDDYDLCAPDVNVASVRQLIGSRKRPVSDDVKLRQRRVRTQTDRQQGRRPARARHHLATRGRALG